MKKPNLKPLVEKFWKGETTFEEENELKYNLEDFNFEDEYPELYDYFGLIEEEQKLSIPKDFKTRLKDIPNTSKFVKETKAPKKKFQYMMAASILLTITIFSLQKQDKDKQQKEAQLAFQEVKASLSLFSKRLNQTAPYLAQVQKFSETQNKINNTIKRSK